MDYVTLGKTGLRASVIGLGGGGHSRLGQRTGAAAATSQAIVWRALDLGVNFIDTAEAYGTEQVIGEALRGVERDSYILSTKKSLTGDDERRITPAALRQGLEASLKRLGTDYVDIYHLHGVQEQQYEYARAELVPEMLSLRDEGKLRFVGITEAFGGDTGHRMMAEAVRDSVWDVIMVGFNILNQSARERVLAETIRQNIGVLCMFAVRTALSKPEKLHQVIDQLIQEGVIAAAKLDREDPLGFVIEYEGVESLTEAAYRFCQAEPGIHVVLSGTGNLEHLQQNIAANLKPALPTELEQRLKDLFASVDSVSGQ